MVVYALKGPPPKSRGWGSDHGVTYSPLSLRCVKGSCKDCTPQQTDKLTCCVCTKTMPLKAFAKAQRKHVEKAVSSLISLIPIHVACFVVNCGLLTIALPFLCEEVC